MPAESAEPSSGVIHLTVPVSTRSLEVARATTTTAASQLIVAWDDLEDLRLAVDELCSALIKVADPAAGGLEVSIELSAGEVGVRGAVSSDGMQRPPELSEVAEMLLATAVDDYQLTEEGDRFVFRLRKLAGQEPS